MAKRTWTDEEIALLAQHKVPQGRSLNAARIKAWELHIPFRPNDPNAEPTVPPRSRHGTRYRSRPGPTTTWLCFKKRCCPRTEP